MWKIVFKLYYIFLKVIGAKSHLQFQVREPYNINLTDYHKCLTRFYESQPVWSWVVLHEYDKVQPFDDMLNVIYSIGVPLYNYQELSESITGHKWFHAHADISTMSKESKIFILSKSKFHLNLKQFGNQTFRRGDKILFSNYDRKHRVDFGHVMNYFGINTASEGLTRYNLLPIVSFLYVSESGQADAVTYIPTNKSNVYQADKVHLSCEKLYSNSIDKLIFNVDYFTIAVFESVHALQDGNDYFGRDAFIGKLLVGSTRFPYVFRTPTDGETYGNEENYSGVYKQVVNGDAQMALNSRFFLTRIMTDNVVEYTYPYNRDDLMILIPVKLSPSQLFYFTHYSYGISLVTIISLFFYFKLTKTRKSIVEVVMIFLMVCSGKSLKEIDAKYFRIIYMSMMVLAFYGYTLFNIQILSALTLQPSELAIKSVKEFADTNYKTYSLNSIKNILTDSLKDDNLAPLIIPRIEPLPNDNETALAEETILRNCSEYAVICTRSTALYYMELSIIQGREFCYNIVPEAIMPSLVTYILGYRSPFQDKFNEVLSRIIETGLVANYTENAVKKKVAISDEVKPFGMETYRERIAWIVYIIGNCVAFFVFVVEVFIWPYIVACFQK